MKRTPKWAFFVVAVLILSLSYLAVFGLYTRNGDSTPTVIKGVGDIRWGIDIQGGVDVTFGPADEEATADSDQLDAVKKVIEQRLVNKNITDYEAYTDPSNNQVIVRFPWNNTEETPEEAVAEIGQTAMLEFHYDDTTDDNGKPTGDLILNGNDVASAKAGTIVDEKTNEPVYIVSLELKESGRQAFATATQKQFVAKDSSENKKISIWLDDKQISAPAVNGVITDGNAMISGSFETYADAKELADLITSGALPFAVEAKSLGSISATMGSNALNSMAIAAVIAMALVVILMIVVYRLPGFVAAIALCGQMAGTVACISGFFPIFNSFTMTLPGIAGLILSIGIGVDCNVITAEAVREEIRAGKTVDSAIRSGSKGSFWAIFDGNITVLIVAAVLMGVFGSSNSLFGILFSWFPVSTTGSVYSFGYTLLIGVILNFIMGIGASRVMLRSVSRLKIFRNPWFYGGDRK